MANKCTSIAGHFDGHGGAPMRYGAHRPMQHDQGFTGSHWTPPSGDYLLRIAPAAASNTTIMEHVPTLLANVKAIVDQKCYGCHNAASKNEKGKAKLDWDAFEATKKSKQLATMAKINETLSKGEMPPAKFLENKPEGKLSESDLATLMEWSAGKKKSKE